MTTTGQQFKPQEYSSRKLQELLKAPSDLSEAEYRGIISELAKRHTRTNATADQGRLRA